MIEDFKAELAGLGLTKVRPHFYLSTEWGVPFDTISNAIPFYLARVDLTDFHADRGGLVEGGDRADVLRYLRHEMGHVINYAYRLYERPEWTRQFGDINLPYEEEYRPRPFSLRYVRHLPGWYAQKHPDEDWAETFAVWMTPGMDWRARYAHWPALAKLEYCDRVMEELRGREPLVTATDPDEDVAGLDVTLDEHYGAFTVDLAEAPADLDEALHSIFTAPGPSAAGKLIRRLERTIAADVYRWTGWFPERKVRRLLHGGTAGDAAATQLALTYLENDETAATVALTTFVTALAMSRVQGGAAAPADPLTP